MQCRDIGISPVHMKNAGEHRHDLLEIILTLQGSGYDLADGQRIPFSRGSVFVVEPGVFHGREAGPEGFQDMFIRLEGNRILQTDSCKSFRDDANCTLEKLFSAAYSIWSRRLPGGQEMTDSILQVICGMLRSAEPATEAGTIADRVRNEILMHYTDPEFTAGDALACSGYCEDYARRVFAAEIGMTPSAYLESMRLEYAERLLMQRTDPPRSIGEIALLSGYFDANYFSRIFRKHTGKSPREYRAEKQKDTGS